MIRKILKQFLLEILSCSAVAAIVYHFRSKKWSKKIDTKRLKEMVSKRRAERKQNVENLQKILIAKSLQYDPELTNMDFQTLREKLQNDELTPVQVLLAFQRKALKVNQDLNCVCEFFDEAYDDALKMTEQFYKKPKRKPPFYGLPLSIKENFKVKGHESTVGLAQRLGTKEENDGVFVTKLKDMGFVLFAQTNLSQTMLSIGSSNPIFGTTFNPWNFSRSSGGSSSGEGALIGAGASLIGLGTDIGGSVRVPAHFCGICSLKPTLSRMSQRDRVSVCSTIGLHSTIGFMSSDVRTLVQVHRELWSNFDYDYTIAPVIFDESSFNSRRPLTIGYYYTDGFVDSSPTCYRAVQKSVATLTRLGHRLVNFSPPDVHLAMDIYDRLLQPDGGKTLISTLNSDLDTTELKRFMTSYDRNSIEMLQETLKHFQTFKIKFWQKFKSANLDCLICPVCTITAPDPVTLQDMYSLGWHYTALYNLLDWPAGVVPSTMGTQDDEQCSSNFGHHVPSSSTYQFLYNFQQHSRLNKLKTLVRREGAKCSGLPSGVQVVAPPFRDEICLRIMLELQENLNFNKFKVS